MNEPKNLHVGHRRRRHRLRRYHCRGKGLRKYNYLMSSHCEAVKLFEKLKGKIVECIRTEDCLFLCERVNR